MSELAFDVLPWTAQWNRWLEHYRGTKYADQMLACIADAATRRALWLRDRLAEILASDVASEDVIIEERASAQTVVIVRGQLQFERSFPAIWKAPAEWPPAKPSPENLTARKIDLICIDADVVDDEAAAILRQANVVRRMAARERSECESKDNRRRHRQESRAERIFEAAREAVLHGNEPHLDDVETLGVKKTIDPYTGAATTKITSLRDDPIGQMHRRGQLLPDEEKKKHHSPAIADARLAAAREWQALYERTELGGVRSFSLLPPVDGGQFVDPVTDDKIDARGQLRALRNRLGFIELPNSQRITGERLLIWVLGDKKTLGQVADLLGFDRRRLQLQRDLIEKLDIVAVHLHVAMRPHRSPPRPRDRHDDLADRYLRSFQTFSGN